MQLANPNSSTDASLNALLLPGAAPLATSAGLTAEARAAFPQFDSFLPDTLAEVIPSTAGEPAIFPESPSDGTLTVGGDLVSISCALTLGRWLVEAEVPSVPAAEDEGNKDSVAADSPCETESPKKTTKPAAEFPVRSSKAKSDQAKVADGASTGLPIDGLLAAGYFPVTEVPLADVELDEETDNETQESSDALVSVSHDELPAEEGEGLFSKLPDAARPDGKPENAEGVRVNVSQVEPHERTRPESAEGASPKTPMAEFSKRAVAELGDTPKAQESRPSENTAERRPALPALENERLRVPLSKGFELGAKLDVSKADMPAPGMAERPDAVLPRGKPADVVLPVDSDASIAGLLSESDASGPKRPMSAEFAVKPVRYEMDQRDEENDGSKNFVSSDKEIVTRQRPVLGITVAKPSSSMSYRFSSLLPDAPVNDRAASAAVMTAGLSEKAEATFADHLELAPVSAAHEAVHVVMNATEQLSLRDQKSVRLQFSVGDAQLDVRVELHANEVRTQFRTDSAELRQALSHEWQSVAAEVGSGDRGLRIAPAVFSASSNDQSAFNAFAGDTSSRQREQRASHEANGRSPRAVATVAGGRATTGAVSTSSRSSRSAPPTSQHLHTLA